MEGGKDSRRTLGQQGEDLACRMLEARGHLVLERNWRHGHLEIDIISADAAGIHFVEVKTRRHSIQAPPQDNVDITKQRRIAKAAQAYLRTRKGLPYTCMESMFDIVAVTFRGDEADIELFEQAYIPIYL